MADEVKPFTLAGSHASDVLLHTQDENAKIYAENQRLKRELTALTAQHEAVCANLNDIRLLLRAVTER